MGSSRRAPSREGSSSRTRAFSSPTVHGGAVDSEDVDDDWTHIAGYVNEPDVNHKYNCTSVQIPYRGPMPEYSHFRAYGGLYMFLLVAVDIPANAELLASYGPEHNDKGYAVREKPPKWESLLYRLHQCASIPVEDD